MRQHSALGGGGGGGEEPGTKPGKPPYKPEARRLRQPPVRRRGRGASPGAGTGHRTQRPRGQVGPRATPSPTQLLTGPRGRTAANIAASGPSDRAAGRLKEGGKEREPEIMPPSTTLSLPDSRSQVLSRTTNSAARNFSSGNAVYKCHANAHPKFPKKTGRCAHYFLLPFNISAF
jgi:hypothetical protein